ncbi:MAG: type II methionyl aminopeptidase [Candidatus Aenigmarchaeota archaeon]|nr:type II methionyl aminopeptidase [Candidatus Aenigmarchaeota archaeon]
MEKEILEKYEKAGKINQEVKMFAREQLKPGVKVLDLAEKIEKMIIDKGGGIAFPVNISLNDIAAHYTPDIDDTLTLKDGDLVKVDIGVHVDGFIADSAFSVRLGEKSDILIKAAEDALEQFIKEIRPGKTVDEMSKLIEDVVMSYGVNPVRNLAGHSLEEYTQHGGLSIPNGHIPSKEEIKEGQVLGMEVFTTHGEGLVKESFPTLIYMLIQPKPVRLRESRKILQLAVDKFKTLPFARRWLKGIGSTVMLQLALKELVDREVLIEYPPLRERSNSLTAQAEETIIVLDKPIITTRS